MTTAAERKARREERLLKEAKKEMMLMALWTCIRYMGAFIGFVLFAVWLALVTQENPKWAIDMCWIVGSLGVGTFLFKKAAK